MSKNKLTLSMFWKNRRGVTITELMVAVTVLAVGVVGGMASFKYISLGISNARLQTIATNLAQEKMEILKNKVYYQLQVTTYSAVSVGYSPNFVYDKGNYPPETITLWGSPPLTRAVNIDYVTLSGSNATILPYTASDPGMKKITVYVFWMERNIRRKVKIDSYYENPSVATLSTGFAGQVCRSPNAATCAAANSVPGALVQVVGTPKWRGYADASGNYSFQVAPGSYSLVCSSQGFFSQSTNMLNVAEGINTTQNFSIAQIATGTVSSASLYTYAPNLVISQVVSSTEQADGFDAQYVELFNPTTAAINIGTSVAAHSIKLNIKSSCGTQRTCQDVNLIYVSTYVASGRYYLIANRSAITVLGTDYTADAYYTDTANTTCSTPPSDWSAPGVKNIIQKTHNGAVWLTNSANETLDAVGWNHHANPAPSPCEGNCIPFNGGGGTIGLLATDQIVRFSTPCAVGTTYGRAYDSGDNASNFYYNNTASAVGLIYQPFSSASPPQTILSGRPSTGAYVISDDGNSPGVVSSIGYVSGAQGQSCLYSSFTMVGVATGTWNIAAVSGNYMQVVSNIIVTQNVNTSVTNAVTSPAWPVANLNYVALSSTYTGGVAVGYVYGAGPSYWTRLNGILVGSNSGGTPVRTDSQGFYILYLPTGTATISANYGAADGNYQTSDVDVTIDQAAITSVPDFHIGQGGFIKGYVTSGTGALPNVVVQASLGSTVFNDTSDGTGYFYIFVSTSSSAWTVVPDVDTLQSYTTVPSPLTAVVTVPGSTVFSGTITVTGGMGSISGTVMENGSAITTGVLVIASTATVPDPPAAVVASSAPARALFYSGSSAADGTYSLEVRGSTTTYNVRAFYPKVDINTGSVSYTSKYRTGVTVSAGATVPGQNFTWP